MEGLHLKFFLVLQQLVLKNDNVTHLQPWIDMNATSAVETYFAVPKIVANRLLTGKLECTTNVTDACNVYLYTRFLVNNRQILDNCIVHLKFDRRRIRDEANWRMESATVMVYERDSMIVDAIYNYTKLKNFLSRMVTVIRVSQPDSGHCSITTNRTIYVHDTVTYINKYQELNGYFAHHVVPHNNESSGIALFYDWGPCEADSAIKFNISNDSDNNCIDFKLTSLQENNPGIFKEMMERGYPNVIFSGDEVFILSKKSHMYVGFLKNREGPELRNLYEPLFPEFNKGFRYSGMNGRVTICPVPKVNASQNIFCRVFTNNTMKGVKNWTLNFPYPVKSFNIFNLPDGNLLTLSKNATSVLDHYYFQVFNDSDGHLIKTYSDNFFIDPCNIFMENIEDWVDWKVFLYFSPSTKSSRNSAIHAALACRNRFKLINGEEKENFRVIVKSIPYAYYDSRNDYEIQ